MKTIIIVVLSFVSVLAHAELAYKYRSAISDMEEDVKEKAYHIQAPPAIAHLYFSDGDFQKAAETLESAIKRDQDHEEFFNLLAGIYIHQGKLKEGLRVLNQGISDAPDFVLVYNRALLKLDLGDESFKNDLARARRMNRATFEEVKATQEYQGFFEKVDLDEILEEYADFKSEREKKIKEIKKIADKDELEQKRAEAKRNFDNWRSSFKSKLTAADRELTGFMENVGTFQGDSHKQKYWELYNEAVHIWVGNREAREYTEWAYESMSQDLDWAKEDGEIWFKAESKDELKVLLPIAQEIAEERLVILREN